MVVIGSFTRPFGVSENRVPSLRSGFQKKLLESPRPMASTTLPTISQVTPTQKRTLIAAALGWGLDGFDVLLYSNVQIHVMNALGIHSKAIAGLPNAFMLLASGIGGVLFGFVADRIGRTKALMLSILTYSLCRSEERRVGEECRSRW